MRLAILLMFSTLGCREPKEYQLPDRPKRHDGTLLCGDSVYAVGGAWLVG